MWNKTDSRYRDEGPSNAAVVEEVTSDAVTIDGALSGIEHRIAALGEQVEYLAKDLHPVLATRPPGGHDEAPRPSQSPMHDRITTANDQLTRIFAAIVDLRGRLHF